LGYSYLDSEELNIAEIEIKQNKNPPRPLVRKLSLPTDRSTAAASESNADFCF
jgi:hypothetical protein